MSQPARQASDAARRVLIVEDDEGLRSLIAKALGKAGCEVSGVSNGTEAIECSIADPGRLLLLDQKLPDMSGREIVIALASHGIQAPFVMMTGQGDERLAVDMMKLGASDYLLKDTDLIDRLPGVMDRVFRAIETEQSLFAAQVALRKSEERLAEINTCLSSLGSDYEANVNQLTALCGRLLGATCALYNRIVGGMLCSIGQWNTPVGYTPKDAPEGHLCYDVIRAGAQEPLVVRNLPETEYAASDPNVLQYGLQSYVGYPVRCGAEVVGSVCAVFQADVAPTADDRRVLTLIATALTREENRKRAEMERESLQIQLSQAQKMESVGRLAGGVAHDFNNMLHVILGTAELASEKAGANPALQADLEEIRSVAQRSADLTRQLLAFARKQTIAPRVLDLNETIEGSLKMLLRLIGENVKLIWSPEASLWAIKIDPSQIDQLIANLCLNARDAIAGNGTIALSTGSVVVDEADCIGHEGAVPGDYVRLSITDDGCGMDEETRQHIFEPFFTTKGVGEGTGLGLATVYGIVVQNGGIIDVLSQKGRGTTFLIYLPRHRSKADLQPGTDKAQSMARGHETILLVEDEPSTLQMTCRMLERHGYNVLPAASPGEAIELAQQHSGEIHLLMTDVVMPEMNGRDLARTLLGLYPDVKRLFMSGYTADIIAHHGVLDEGVRFIQKPFAMKDLAAKVREALDGERS